MTIQIIAPEDGEIGKLTTREVELRGSHAGSRAFNSDLQTRLRRLSKELAGPARRETYSAGRRNGPPLAPARFACKD